MCAANQLSADREDYRVGDIRNFRKVEKQFAEAALDGAFPNGETEYTVRWL